MKEYSGHLPISGGVTLTWRSSEKHLVPAMRRTRTWSPGRYVTTLALLQSTWWTEKCKYCSELPEQMISTNHSTYSIRSDFNWLSVEAAVHNKCIMHYIIQSYRKSDLQHSGLHGCHLRAPEPLVALCGVFHVLPVIVGFFQIIRFRLTSPKHARRQIILICHELMYCTRSEAGSWYRKSKHDAGFNWTYAGHPVGLLSINPLWIKRLHY